MRLLIRVDAYPDIALGHLGRCISLASTIQEQGHSVFFVSYEDSTAQQLLDAAAMDYRLIPYKVNTAETLEQELQLLEELASDMDALLLDSYSADHGYMDALRPCYSRLIYMDDLGLDFNVDMVINPSCKQSAVDYKADTALTGMDYVILSEDYAKGRESGTEGNKQSILVTVGGVDHYDLSSRVLPLLEELAPEIEVNMVIGPYYENKQRIRKVAENSGLTVHFLEGLTNISNVIRQSDLALTAGGFTTYELAAMSTPCVGVALWDNQKANIECLSKQHALLPLFYSDGTDFDERLKSALSQLLTDQSLRVNMAQQARSTIDGMGAKRIGNEIINAYG